jgi:uncharacterized C2H2 Zn-finger protein
MILVKCDRCGKVGKDDKDIFDSVNIYDNSQEGQEITHYDLCNTCRKKVKNIIVECSEERYGH